jgi:predicted GNAT family N-acyltransferase
MALKILDHGSSEYQKMVHLRHEILRKPLGLEFTAEELDKEKHEILVGAFEDDDMLGCCMVVKESDTDCRLRQMAVVNTLRGKGIGRALMTFAENIARDRGFKKMIMHARKTALGFYEKQGYVKKGDEFIEITIPHYIMEKTLAGDEIPILI